jgi:hypothetical protein
MPEQNQPPRPHGDPLNPESVEPNTGQRQSDAPPDVVGQRPGREEPTAGTTSTANGTQESDEEEGRERRKRYDDGADLVSRID